MKEHVQTGSTKAVSYIIWITNLKSEIRYELRGRLEAVLASKPFFFVLEKFHRKLKKKSASAISLPDYLPQQC